MYSANSPIKKTSYIPYILVAVFVLNIIFIFVNVKMIQIQGAMAMGAKMGPPPDAVTTTLAKKTAWQKIFRSSGTIRSNSSAVLQTQQPGTVVAILKPSGSMVKKGEIIVKLDTAAEEGDLKAADAKLNLASEQLSRAKKLRAVNGNSPSDLDTAEAGLLQAKAEVDRAKAQVDRKSIVAPFDGVLGVVRSQVGDYVTIGTSLATVQGSDSLQVQFSLADSAVSLLNKDSKIKLSIDDQNATAKLISVDSVIDPTTRTITVEGELDSQSSAFIPGRFVAVEVETTESIQGYELPVAAIKFAPYGNSAFIAELKKDEKTGTESKFTSQKFITIGERRGDAVLVTQGLSDAEEVITSGVFKLRPNAKVNVNNSSVTPSSQQNPKVNNT